jgi:hypothetical protein
MTPNFKLKILVLGLDYKTHFLKLKFTQIHNIYEAIQDI